LFTDLAHVWMRLLAQNFANSSWGAKLFICFVFLPEP
jgi:hypothetical protein